MKFSEVIGTDLLNSLIPHIKNLLEDKKWKVRIAAYETIVDLGLFYQVKLSYHLS